jgi:hypothetical protein
MAQDEQAADDKARGRAGQELQQRMRREQGGGQAGGEQHGGVARLGQNAEVRTSNFSLKCTHHPSPLHDTFDE